MTRACTALALTLLTFCAAPDARATVLLRISGTSNAGDFTGTVEFDQDAPTDIHAGYGSAVMIGLRVTIHTAVGTFSDAQDYTGFRVNHDDVTTGAFDPSTRQFIFLSQRSLSETLPGGASHVVDQKTEIDFMTSNGIDSNDFGKSWWNLLSFTGATFEMFRGEGLDGDPGAYPAGNYDVIGTIESVTLVTPEPSPLAAGAVGLAVLVVARTGRRRAA